MVKVKKQAAKDPNYWVNQIYLAAKFKNVSAMKNLLAQGICIDEYYLGLPFTPMSKLASEGDKDSVEFLLEFGADINIAAIGAAIYDQSYGEYFLNYYDASPLSVALGAAASGKRNFCEALRTKHELDSSLIAGWAAWSGNFEYANFLLAEHHASINTVVRSAAFGGHFEFVDTLVRQYPNDVLMHDIASGAARGGYRDRAENLRTQRGADVMMIACSAAKGGYRDYLEFLRPHIQSATEIAENAAATGHRQLAEYIRKNFSVRAKDVAFSAASAGYRAYAEYLYRKHHAGIDAIACGYLVEGCSFKKPMLALREFSYISNENFRLALAKKMLEFDHEPLPNIVELAHKAGFVSKLKEKYGVTHEQAVTWLTNTAFRNTVLCSHTIPKRNDDQQQLLPRDVFFCVLSFLAPRLSFRDIAVLYSIKITIAQSSLKELQIALSKYTLFGRIKKHYHEAQGLLKDIENKESDVVINNKISQQLAQEPKPSYKKILERHHRR